MKTNLTVTLALLLAFVLVNIGFGQQGFPAGPGNLAAPSFDMALDSAITKHFQEKNLPGLVVLYARDGMLVYKKTLGFADIQSQTKVTENHIFRLASVSKLLAATISLREQELGHINLNDKIKTCLPQTPSHHTYRVIDLLSCRSGVRHYGEPTSPKSPEKWAGKEYGTALEASKQFWHDPLVGPVGDYHYSSFGYSIAGAALEAATGKSIGQTVIGTLATPYGLATLDAEDPSENKPMRVTLYQLNDEDNVASGNKKISRDNLSWKVLGGGLECSGMDLLKFGIKLSDSKIISADSLKKLMTPPQTDASYALGCNVAIENGVKVFAKDGGQPGASTYIWCIPEKRMVMVVLTNRQESGGASTLGKSLRTIVLNSAAATNKKADLVVENFKKTGMPSYKNGNWEIPFQFDVRNQGKGAVNNNFVNGILVGDGTEYRWSGFMESLAPNGTTKSAKGTIKIKDAGKVMAGRTFKLTAHADAPIAAADTSMSPNGRVSESSEANNKMVISGTLPGGAPSGISNTPPSTSQQGSGSAPKRVKRFLNSGGG